jgi:hypothetical protein
MELSMKEMRSDPALQRVLDALEAELMQASDEEIAAVVAETGMSARALLADPLRLFRSMIAASHEEEEALEDDVSSPARLRERDAQA